LVKYVQSFVGKEDNAIEELKEIQLKDNKLLFKYNLCTTCLNCVNKLPRNMQNDKEKIKYINMITTKLTNFN
jgi:dissimilatory sulfite reductase (desulfoviridin) alpha/beta subunit